MSKPDNTIETLLNRLEAGEDLSSIQVELGDEASDYADIITLLQAQKITAKPDPEGLKQALLQSNLIADGGRGNEWGSFSRVFRGWKTWGGALSVLALGILTANWWYAPPTTAPAPEVNLAKMRSAQMAPQMAVMRDESMMMAESADFADAGSVLDEDLALLEAWETELAADMNEINTTKAELESLYADPLFSAVIPNQS